MLQFPEKYQFSSRLYRYSEKGYLRILASPSIINCNSGMGVRRTKEKRGRCLRRNGGEQYEFFDGQ